MPVWVDDASLEQTGHKAKAPVTGVGYLCRISQNPKITHGCPWGLSDKTLKTPHTLDAQRRETKLELHWKIPPNWLTFIVPDGATEAAEDGWMQGKPSWSFPCSKLYML